MKNSQSPCFVIAEAGVNHNGSLATALELVKVAAEAGADAVKFQSFRAQNLVRRGTPTAAYQQRNADASDQFAMLKALEMSEEMHEALVAECRRLGIEFMSTPFDADLADYLVGLGMRRIKVPSGELTNIPLLRHLAAHPCPLLVSTGMADLQEISVALAAIAEVRGRQGRASDVTLLHCTSNYPAEFEDVNLRAMRTMAERFEVPVGYSDHTLGITMSLGAVALGAVVIEKHFTLSRDMAGPDHKASLEPHELKSLVSEIRHLEAALGDGVKAPRPSELPVRAIARRSLVAACDLSAGEAVAVAHIEALRPASGISPAEIDRVIGRHLRHSVKAGEILQWEMFE